MQSCKALTRSGRQENTSSLLVVTMDRCLIFCSVVIGLLAYSSTLAGAQIGVDYGMVANNLPTPDKVVSLFKSLNISRVRLFDPNPDALKALSGSGIEVVIGTRNEDLQNFSTNATFAADWVNTNVVPYANNVKFRYIIVGNEPIPPPKLGPTILPSLQNVDAALTAAGLAIPVTVSLSTKVLGASFPPSQGVFNETMAPDLNAIVAFLVSKKTPLLVTVYPWFAFARDPNVRLDYALFTAPGVVVQDGPLGYRYLFDAIIDATYAALERAGGASIDIVVSETGWPWGGGPTGATVDNARTYNNNLLAHLRSGVGTPKRPGKAIETYLFAMFNENLKREGIEQHWGMFFPDMKEVYHLNFV